MPGKSVVILISGAGSNLQAIIDASKSDASINIVGVLSNRADAYGLERATDAQIPTAIIDHTQYSDRLSFDQAMMAQIDAWKPDLVVLAGFMRILTSEFVNHFAGRLINIHPSLLPKFKGTQTHARALEAGESEHGCTVHYVTEELDAGASIVQAATPILASDTVESLVEKVHVLEHQIYPLAVAWICSGRLISSTNGITLDDEPLGPSGFRFTG